MQKSTRELFDILKSDVDIADYLKSNRIEFMNIDLRDYLNGLLEEKGIEKSEVIRRSGLDRTYAYQIYSGLKKPSRDKLLALGFGMGMNLEEIQVMLQVARYPTLYPRDERDSVIIFGIHHRSSIQEVNELLYEMKMSIIQ